MKATFVFSKSEFEGIKKSLDSVMKEPITLGGIGKRKLENGDIAFDGDNITVAIEEPEEGIVSLSKKAAWIIGTVIPTVKAATETVVSAIFGPKAKELIDRLKEIGVKDDLIPDLRQPIEQAVDSARASREYTRRILVGEKIGQPEDIEIIISTNSSSPELGKIKLDGIERSIRRLY
jgi:hypothetical protein